MTPPWNPFGHVGSCSQLNKSLSFWGELGKVVGLGTGWSHKGLSLNSEYGGVRLISGLFHIIAQGLGCEKEIWGLVRGNELGNSFDVLGVDAIILGLRGIGFRMLVGAWRRQLVSIKAQPGSLRFNL